MFVLGDEENDKEVLALRPMTCPFQYYCYKNTQKSYRDLPYRMSETSTLFRNEDSGEMHGLTRVRQFTISEGHLIIRPDQTNDELKGCLHLAQYCLSVLGVQDDVTYRLSKWDPNNKEKYLGDDEYEKFITTGIQDCLNQLGFDRSQLILSGLSMGTFGALYNGCKLQPHAIIIGKPLASLGDIAVNERISRPGGFPTSLDVLVKNCGDMSQKSIDSLNHHFWDLFDQTDWSQTKFIVSYMLEDDYDMTAYNRLISHIDDVGVEIIGKGIHGRHNDDTYSIVAWFKTQFDETLKLDFKRGDLDEE